MKDTPLLQLENVSVGYGRLVVLPAVNLKLPAGSFTGLLGANGSGKSTLIRTILGIIPPVSGRVVFRAASGSTPALGYAPQRDTLDPIYLLSSFEVVLMGAYGRIGPGRWVGREERDWAWQCLRQTGAEQFGRKQFSELSGGQKQRVLIARTLAAKPDFLLLDEPTSGIDVSAKQAVMEVLKEVHETQRLTILMASHDLPVVRAFTPHVVWLHKGSVLEGSAEELLTRERVEDLMDMDPV